MSSALSMTRTSEWDLLEGIPSDITIQIGDAYFNLHRLPLVSKSGYMKKIVAAGSKTAVLDLTGIPGGAPAFTAAASFCYGRSFDISTGNVAAVKCAAEYLEMTEQHAAGNLSSKADAFLERDALRSAAGAAAVLRQCEELLPAADDIGLLRRCVDALASTVCSVGDGDGGGVEWWAEELTALRINTFERLVTAMTARGMKALPLGALIMLYAHKSLRSLDLSGGGSSRKAGTAVAEEEQEKRAVVETVVRLLPNESNTISVSFLSMLLRAAVHLDATVACRLDLERRMAMQLPQAALDDLLIPSGESGAAFDVDTVRRILATYMESPEEEYLEEEAWQVSRLMEAYLGEVASDRSLAAEKFVGLAELIPERARVNCEDGMYRAIDIFLKAHPGVGEGERRRVCGVVDWRRLSREACAHAAQNERLPVQTVVQVLASEQQRRLRMAAAPLSGRETPRRVEEEEVARLREENDALRMEVMRMKMKERPPLPATKRTASFIGAVSKQLFGKLSLFGRSDGGGVKARTRPPKDRRHSVS